MVSLIYIFMRKISIFNSIDHTEAYLRALKTGSCDVSYMGVMLIGYGGVGKSSLLCGLKNKPPPKLADSTPFAHLSSVKDVEAKSESTAARKATAEWTTAGETYWKDTTEEEELDEMANLILDIRDEEASASSMSGVAEEGEHDEADGEEVSGSPDPHGTSTPRPTATPPHPAAKI